MSPCEEPTDGRTPNNELAGRESSCAPAHNALRSGIIAVIDDDECARSGLRALLESLGYEVAVFASAEEYLASDIRESARFLILDVHLLGMNGPDLQAHLIGEGRCPPTIFVTGRFEDHVRKRVMQAGALSYLIKPPNEKTLFNCLRAAA